MGHTMSSLTEDALRIKFRVITLGMVHRREVYNMEFIRNSKTRVPALLPELTGTKLILQLFGS